jgi:hypothetical protein
VTVCFACGSPPASADSVKIVAEKYNSGWWKMRPFYRPLVLPQSLSDAAGTGWIL